MTLPELNKWNHYKKCVIQLPPNARKLINEGQWIIYWNGVNTNTGVILTGYVAVMNCNLYVEARIIEKELRKKKIIITEFKFLKKEENGNK